MKWDIDNIDTGDPLLDAAAMALGPVMVGVSPDRMLETQTRMLGATLACLYRQGDHVAADCEFVQIIDFLMHYRERAREEYKKHDTQNDS